MSKEVVFKVSLNIGKQTIIISEILIYTLFQHCRYSIYWLMTLIVLE